MASHQMEMLDDFEPSALQVEVFNWQRVESLATMSKKGFGIQPGRILDGVLDAPGFLEEGLLVAVVLLTFAVAIVLPVLLD